jgi:hypothetical protein
MAAPTNELVRSNEEIQATLSEPDNLTALDSEPDGLTSDPETDDEGLRSWEDAGDDEGADAKATKDASTRTRAATVREFKANGKTHQVDMSDEAAVSQLISLGLGARPVFSERDKLRKTAQEYQAKVADLQRYKENWDKLEDSKHDKAALYEKIFGTKWADDIKAEREWQDRYNTASPAEQRFMDMQRDWESKQRQQTAQQGRRDKELADLETAKDNLKRETIKSTMVPEFARLEFSARIKDEATAARMNKALWRLTISDLKEQFGNADDIPPAAIRKAFRETHDMLWGQHKQAAKQTVKEVVDTKKKAAKEQAQLASTRNYSGAKPAKELPADPVKLFRRMFR